MSDDEIRLIPWPERNGCLRCEYVGSCDDTGCMYDYEEPYDGEDDYDWPGRCVFGDYPCTGCDSCAREADIPSADKED